MNIEFEELKVFDTKLGTYVPRELLAKAQADADRRLERIRTINAVLKEKWQKGLYRDELVRKLNVIQSIVEQELMLEAERQGDEYIESEGAHHKLEDFDDAKK